MVKKTAYQYLTRVSPSTTTRGLNVISTHRPAVNTSAKATIVFKLPKRPLPFFPACMTSEFHSTHSLYFNSLNHYYYFIFFLRNKTPISFFYKKKTERKKEKVKEKKKNERRVVT